MSGKKYYTSLISAGLTVCLELLAWGALPGHAVEFVPPNVGAPRGRVGGGTRGGEQLDGQVQPRNNNPFGSVEPGAPGRRIGGGSRGCSLTGGQSQQKFLTALLPETTVGLTVQEYPTFYWYMPETSANAVEFVLMDEKGEKVIYETTFQTKGKAGIVSLTLPENASLPPLEVNKYYQWYFSIICNPEDRAADLYVQGWIQRVQPSAGVEQQLAQAPTLRDRVFIYAQQGIWHDTVNSLAQLLRANPNDSTLKADWAQLLQSVGLNNVAEAPILQEVTLEQNSDQQSNESHRQYSSTSVNIRGSQQ